MLFAIRDFSISINFINRRIKTLKERPIITNVIIRSYKNQHIKKLYKKIITKTQKRYRNMFAN